VRQKAERQAGSMANPTQASAQGIKQSEAIDGT